LAHFFGRFVAAILFFSKLDFGFLVSDLKNSYIHIFTEIDKFLRIMASFSAFQPTVRRCVRKAFGRVGLVPCIRCWG
jgi:hypothetical protein